MLYDILIIYFIYNLKLIQTENKFYIICNENNNKNRSVIGFIII